MNLFQNLQVGDNDLIGNKFNGHDLHLYLRNKGIDSSHLVWNKESDDNSTYIIGGNRSNRDSVNKFESEIKNAYALNGIFGSCSYDILYSKLFLDTDVVHYHLIHNMNFDIQLLPILSNLKPTVWTLHDPWGMSGHCIHHFDCDKWKSGCGDCPFLTVPFSMEVDNTALNFEIKKNAIKNSKLDVIVASKWLEKQVTNSEIFKNSRIHYVPFGVNQKIFRPLDKIEQRKQLNIPIDATVIMARCTYSDFKGFDYIQFVLEGLKCSNKVYLLLVGEQFRGISKDIEILEYGWVKDDNLLSQIYNASDLFLMPSIVDTFGMMAIEAMSCGVMPIVLEGTALPDVINSKTCGVSVERDKNLYLNTVQLYLDNKDLRESRSIRCLKFAQKEYGIDKYVTRIINVYKEAINHHKIENNYRYILQQLKKHMSREDILSLNQKSDIVPKINIVKLIFNKLFSFLPNTNRNKVIEDIGDLNTRNIDRITHKLDSSNLKNFKYQEELITKVDKIDLYIEKIKNKISIMEHDKKDE